NRSFVPRRARSWSAGRRSRNSARRRRCRSRSRSRSSRTTESGSPRSTSVRRSSPSRTGGGSTHTEATHIPALAAGDAPQRRRSLILAGGGMRVAYQAGVLRALEEDGLRFVHADGTSGGTINLAMLFSGLSPAEMVERWRTLRMRDFVSFLPLSRYLRSPNLMALGDADGLVGRVYPHLGIDVSRIRGARGIEGTFNVCNYDEKTNIAVPHVEIDLDLLVAGVS